ncbi:unnamed protein product [Acanthoscelides obtectus]|uniref:General transcription factor 3C polypeptide 1 n=1 Tax=Acanthoscelides obtectus TaxID=200917 RepID=A0A9P0JZT8_ACAOB|nr:unnamed protein product [Acanthoscelides obtectus]CAK1631497.1 General transcription factor 3C polypeptide 1 [Acanthoscelides obtectus]
MGKVIEVKQIVKPKKRRLKPGDTNDDPPVKVPRRLSSKPIHAKSVSPSGGKDDQEKVTLHEEVYTVLASNGDVCLKIKTEEVYDLFLEDELTNAYFCCFKDLYFHIIDEIALEGLDGITIQACWKRLSICLQKPFYRNTNIEEYIWQIILDNDNIQFFKLAEPRKPLIIFNRYNYIDPELGSVCDVVPTTPDIYPYHYVTAENVQGSCSTFDTRVNITEEVKHMTLQDVLKKFGSQVVIVADQCLRTSALLFETTDPVIQLMPLEYGVLERIGRARYYGELTAGFTNIAQALSIENKSLHHYQKRLLENSFITKQHFYFKSVIDDQNSVGSLLTLSRFHCKIKYKNLILTDKVVNILKNMPGYRCETKRISDIFKKNYRTLRKVFKSAEFKRFVRPDISLPYRAVYPNASRNEYMRKSKRGEKMLRVCELIDPNINVIACWNNLMWDEVEDDDDDDEAQELGATGDKFMNMNMCHEVYTHIVQSGNKGITHMEILKLMCTSFYSTRMALRKLLARDVITKKMTDGGRQRYTVYFAKCFEVQNESLDKIDIKPKLEEISSIKARMIEKQRAAIQKQGCEDYVLTVSEMPASGIGCYFRKYLEIESNFIPRCVFLITSVTLMDSIANIEDLNFFQHGCRNYLIRLKYISRGKLIPINDWLRELSPQLHPDTEKLHQVYIDNDKKFETDFITKLILLKLLFEEIELSEESFEMQRHKRKASTTIVNTSTEKAVNEKLNYMGSNPEIIWRNEEGELEEIMEQSTRPEEYRYESILSFPESEHLSDKVMARLQILLDFVNKVKVVDDMINNTVKHIEDIEVKAGGTYRVDRKSLQRLLKRLVTEGYIKIYRLTIQSSNAKRTQLYACHPSVGPTDSLLRQLISQVKFKYFVAGGKRNVKINIKCKEEPNLEEPILDAPFRQGDVVKSITEWNDLKRFKKNRDVKIKFSQKVARQYGVKPKFIRMRILHELLYYLSYTHEALQEPLTQEQVKELFKTYCIELTEEELNQMPPIYCNELSWRTFIGPLPDHKGWPTGWVLLLDVIMRLPVCLFLKMHSCTIECPQLLDIINHPIKRFYLVKDLPTVARNAILFRGKYSSSIYDVVTRLAFCGLIQFGPQKSKDREQVFIYINRAASLLDTSSSESAYNKVTNKEYPQLNFHFNDLTDIESYWTKLHCISMSTKLNARVPGQLITYTDLSANHALKKTLEFKMPHETIQYDNGEIPGDRRGAAGLDSSLWCHIIRNWYWNTGNKKKREAFIQMDKEKVEKRDSTVLVPFHQMDKKTRKVYLHNERPSPKISDNPKHNKEIEIGTFRTSKRVKQITRVIKPRPCITKKQKGFDHIDRMITKRIGFKKKVTFTKEEDRLLMLCKAADMLLSLNSLTDLPMVSYSTVRDVIHRMCRDSRNKTTRVIVRRVRVYIKPQLNPENIRNLVDIPEIKKYVMPFVQSLGNEKDSRPTDNHIRIVYITLVAYMFQHQSEVFSCIHGNTLNINHLHPNNLANTEKSLEEKSPIIFKEANTENDISRNSIKCVVLSSLLCATSPVLLYKVYECFPDELIREAVDELSKSQIISARKHRKKINAQIVWQIPYKLSNKFFFLLRTTYDPITANDAYQALQLLKVPNEKRIIDWTPKLASRIDYGRLLGFNEFFTVWDRLRFKFNIPESTVILNPDIEDHSDVVNEIAVRYQWKIKRMVQEKAEPDPDEDEIDQQSTHTDSDYQFSQTQYAKSQSKTITIIEDDMDVPETSLDGDIDTIDRLKVWVSDCMKVERRSPSPEFFVDEGESERKSPATDDQDQEGRHPDREISVGGEKRYEKSDKIFKFDYVPSLKEIEEELMKVTPPDEERRIPYITDLAHLLNRDNFSESKMSDDDLDKLKQHFVTQFSSLENLILDDIEQLYDSPTLKFIEDHAKNHNIWKKVQSDLIFKDVGLIPDVDEVVQMACGGVEDMDISNQIVAYVLSKGVFGATGPELQATFPCVEKSFLVTNVMRLIDAGILIRVGICTLRFVHYTHRYIWLVDAYQIPIEIQNADDEEQVKEIAKQLEGSATKSVRVVPWAKITGQLDKQMLSQWLCRLLSHVINNPRITLWNLCAKFPFLRPVEVFYILEILQEIGCIKLYTYNSPEADLFSDWTIPYEVPTWKYILKSSGRKEAL